MQWCLTAPVSILRVFSSFRRTSKTWLAADEGYYWSKWMLESIYRVPAIRISNRTLIGISPSVHWKWKAYLIVNDSSYSCSFLALEVTHLESLDWRRTLWDFLHIWAVAKSWTCTLCWLMQLVQYWQCQTMLVQEFLSIFFSSTLVHAQNKDCWHRNRSFDRWPHITKK